MSPSKEAKTLTNPPVAGAFCRAALPNLLLSLDREAGLKRIGEIRDF
jgi:hypothetical protein